ncbi:hypothetical protein RJ639_030131 [Escallonia herrerae]|uniref:DNA-directed primase/polymerase protein n=1 Tax=Escallonia herrerae TaxID=1293975 RepID=A0AA88X5H6_9ASTE|nr:hypothetical protein RJ639_030131 [Escallonia herrerae]
MDDVDRLFECFKCGVSPPQSAVRERRIKRSKLKQASSVKEASTSLDMPSAGPSGKTQQHSTDSSSRMQNVYTASTSNCLEPMEFLFIGAPCHLYFDLEFNKQENAEKNGDEMVDLLLVVVFDALLEKYSIQGNHDWIVELDSSTKGMVSDGWICSRVHSSRGRDKRFEKLFISKGDSSSADIACQLFVDTAVYSRNRCFRLPLSSKAGKSSLLLPTGRFKCKDMSEEDMFMASLICNMDVDCEKLLICKMDLDCVKALHFDTETNSEFLRESTFPRNFVSDVFTSDASRTYLIGKSPFPALDVFVESIASLGNVSGGYLNVTVCYRSPLRPIPSEAITDSTILLNLVGRNDIQEHITHYTPDSCKTEKWLLEAIRVTDKVESMQKTLDLTDRDQTGDEDDDWWMAVERAASQTELMNLEKAKVLVEMMTGEGGFGGVSFESKGCLEEVVREGDIVSCATSSEVALVMGPELKAGAHLDLVGSYKESMRECDDEAIRRGRVFVDNDAALVEAGELVGAFKRGVVMREEIGGNLVELIRGTRLGGGMSRRLLCSSLLVPRSWIF